MDGKGGGRGGVLKEGSHVTTRTFIDRTNGEFESRRPTSGGMARGERERENGGN